MTGSPSRSARAPRMSKPRQPTWEKLVAPLEEMMPSALAGPGVSRPTARTDDQAIDQEPPGGVQDGRVVAGAAVVKTNHDPRSRTSHRSFPAKGAAAGGPTRR